LQTYGLRLKSTGRDKSLCIQADLPIQAALSLDFGAWRRFVMRVRREESPVKIADNCVVSIHYTLTDDDGNIIDSSAGSEPMNYIQGLGHIIVGLERALEGKSAGETLKVVVQPEEAYGPIDPDLIQTLPREAFSGIDTIEVGMEFQAQSDDSHIQYVVVKDVTDEEVTVDSNHALAGKVLHFDVSIENVREADEEEIAHGHVH
jgi:FKBP-type peptidyl-prolyl cis-trans isomerase SlyD